MKNKVIQKIIEFHQDYINEFSIQYDCKEVGLLYNDQKTYVRVKPSEFKSPLEYAFYILILEYDCLISRFLLEKVDMIYQYKLENYYIDFCFIYNDIKLCIELDGYNQVLNDIENMYTKIIKTLE